MQIVALGAVDEAADGGPRVTPVGVLKATLALILVANLVRIPFISTGERAAPVLFNDICVMAALTAGALSLVRRRSFRLDAVTFAALAFATVGFFSAVGAVPRFGLSGFELVVSLAYLARWLMYMALYLFVINCVKPGQVFPVWRVLDQAMLAFAMFGVAQAIFLPDFAQMVYPDSRLYYDWDPQGHRLVSTMLDPNIAAAMILIALLVQLSRLACGVPVERWKPFVLTAALVLTLSRSGVLAFIVGASVILSSRGLDKRLLRFGALVFALTLAALPKLIEFGAQYSRFSISDVSTVSRFVSWGRALSTIADHPWFGIGFNTYGFVQERLGYERLGRASYSADGGLLFAAVMTGVVGLVLYVAMSSIVIARCRSVWRDMTRSAEDRGLALGAAASTAALLTHSLFVNSLFTPFVMEMQWVLWGLSFLIWTQRAATATHADAPGSRWRLVSAG